MCLFVYMTYVRTLRFSMEICSSRPIWIKESLIIRTRLLDGRKPKFCLMYKCKSGNFITTVQRMIYMSFTHLSSSLEMVCAVKEFCFSDF